MQVFARSRFVTEPLKFSSQVQHTELKINDHQIISRAMEQGFSDLIFKDLVPPLKSSNVVWFRHGYLQFYILDRQKTTKGRFRDEGRRLLFYVGRCLTHCPKASVRFARQRMLRSFSATSHSNAACKQNWKSCNGL